MSDFILVSTAGRSYRLRKDEIVRVESCNDHPVIFMIGGKQYVYSHHLKILEEELASKSFFRVHKSHVVNLIHIEFVDWSENSVMMIDKTGVPIAVRNKSKLRRLLK